MPTYEYKCDACGVEFERFQSIKAAPVKVCPECKKAKVRRLISSGAGLIFKGSGFYITDYRSDGYKKAAQSDSGTSTTASSGSTSTGSSSTSTASSGDASTASSGGNGAAAKTETKSEKMGSGKAAGK
jgi:putative FmdB family regulatory protein